MWKKNVYKFICFKKKQTVICVALCINVFVLIYFALQQHILPSGKNICHKIIRKRQGQGEVTVVFREFEVFDNTLKDDIDHLKQQLRENINIVIISDKQPYPPLKINLTENVKILNLDFDVNRPASYSHVANVIPTKLVLFLQDGCRVKNISNLKYAIKQFTSQDVIKAYAFQTGENSLTCPGIEIDIKRWTVKLEDFTGTEGLCDFVEGEQAVLLKTSSLEKLSNPWARPLAKSIYFQLAFKRWKTLVYKTPIFSTRKQLQPMSQYQHKQLEKLRLATTYKTFGMRQIIYNRHKHEYIGCTKDTERCFGSVINDVPDYIYEKKWTPPCCLKAIRETALHVFSILDKNSVRYWLEGGSLLGAARHNDIIPWDYDVDIGIYEDDMKNCKEILKAKEKQYLDEEGFMWEKGIEGDFFRVHYSDINRNHVDIFPFYSKNGVMTKNTWFKSHRQDTEFPEHFLKPLTTIMFLGRNVSVPNNVKDFLELKFGKGVIEHPQYPNSKSVY